MADMLDAKAVFKSSGSQSPSQAEPAESSLPWRTQVGPSGTLVGGTGATCSTGGTEEPLSSPPPLSRPSFSTHIPEGESKPPSHPPSTNHALGWGGGGHILTLDPVPGVVPPPLFFQ